MSKKKQNDGTELIRSWSLPTSATLGSAVRAKGILQEVRARLPAAVRKSVELDGNALTVVMAGSSRGAFRSAVTIITETLEAVPNLPVIPREIEDILTISTSERHRWLDDGRLPSAGTRTVRLAGRARQITFHVFDPAVVVDLLDRGVVDEWREDDIAARAENRRRSAMKAKLTRSLKKKTTDVSSSKSSPDARDGLTGWDEFDRDGFLR